MIDLAELLQYFPEANKPIKEGSYTFTIKIEEDKESSTFIVNLKIKQTDNKEDHLIKFRLGVGKDKETSLRSHDPSKPHFEIEIYKREKESFSATVYFTFSNIGEEKLMEYCKGTIVVIVRAIESFCKSRKLDKAVIRKLVYSKEVLAELSEFESELLEELYECYKTSQLIVREKGGPVIIKNLHNLQKYLNVEELSSIYLPLKRKIEESSHSPRKI